MPRIVSDTQELRQAGETAPPTSAAVPQAGRSVLERLLASLCNLTPACSLSEVVSDLLKTFSEILPGYALGVRIPGDDDTPGILLCVPPIEARPDDAWAVDVDLFPQYAHERRIALPCRPEPACLHCAGDDPALDKDDAHIVRNVAYCANVLNAAIRMLDAEQARVRREDEVESLQCALAQSDKLASLGEISAGLVHELTNPLTSIVAYTDYLRRKLERRGDDPEDIERLRRVGEAADLILNFTRSIVTYAKPDDVEPSPVDVAQVIDQALVFCKHIADESSVTIRREITPQLPPVRAVRGQLTQVVVNLVTNACQAMIAKGGSLILCATASPDGQSVVLRFEDDGPGINPDHLKRVFDPFFTTKAEGVGTGLGLNIVQRIVVRFGGTITVDSTPGKGACFVVELPCGESTAR